MKLGQYMPVKLNNGFVSISEFMGSELVFGDCLYMLLRKSYFVLMTSEQYDRLLAELDAKIVRASPSKKQKYLDDKAKVTTYVHRCNVHGDGIEFGRRVYISADVREKYSILDTGGVRCTKTGYEFWNPSLFAAYFPEVVVSYNEDNLSVYFNADNSFCCCSIEGHLDVKCGDPVVIISGDGFLEVRPIEQWKKMLQSYKDRISDKSISIDVKQIFRALLGEVSADFKAAIVNSRGRIYIPMEYARKHGFCEASCTKVAVEVHEGFIRLITPSSNNLSCDRVAGGDRKPR